MTTGWTRYHRDKEGSRKKRGWYWVFCVNVEVTKNDRLCGGEWWGEGVHGRSGLAVLAVCGVSFGTGTWGRRQGGSEKGPPGSSWRAAFPLVPAVRGRRPGEAERACGPCERATLELENGGGPGTVLGWEWWRRREQSLCAGVGKAGCEVGSGAV